VNCVKVRYSKFGSPRVLENVLDVLSEESVRESFNEEFSRRESHVGA
jgi:hypothetical protein